MPSSPSDAADCRPPRTAAAGSPCRRGSTGGSARNSPRARAARRARTGPWRPSHGSSRCRTPCRRARASGTPSSRYRSAASKTDMHLTARQVRRQRALGARRELVPQPDVRERAAHHHVVVPAPGAVGVEVARRDAVLGEVAPGRRIGLDRAGGRDVVGGDRVTHLDQRPDVLRRRCSVRDVEVREERRLLHVGGGGVPRVLRALGRVQGAPVLVAFPDLRVLARRTGRW